MQHDRKISHWPRMPVAFTLTLKDAMAHDITNTLPSFAPVFKETVRTDGKKRKPNQKLTPTEASKFRAANFTSLHFLSSTCASTSPDLGKSWRNTCLCILVRSFHCMHCLINQSSSAQQTGGTRRLHTEHGGEGARFATRGSG